MKKRPIAVTAVGWLYIAVGAVSTTYHVYHFRSHSPDLIAALGVIAVGAIAVIAGAFMLRGHNWARWLALAWMALHVALSFVDPLHNLIVHSLLLVLIAYLLFRCEVRQYFHPA